MREKVLIVDDIELNREILAVALGDEYEVLQASDGVQTIEILKTDSEGITVMLLYLIMPNVDGYAVLDYMREHGLLERIPVIVISAESARDVEVKCLEMGVTDLTVLRSGEESRTQPSCSCTRIIWRIKSDCRQESWRRRTNCFRLRQSRYVRPMRR